MLLKSNYKCLIASTSTLHQEDYLEYLLPTLIDFFKDTNKILFIPYARPGGLSHDEYTAKANSALASIGKTCIGIHTFTNPIEAVYNAKGIFTGGGNSFVLLQQLYKYNLLDALKKSIETGTAYLGTSAGSNICGLSIKTTNDMPIVYPPSFNALGILPFLINPHYLDTKPDLKHMGESRETRIKEFLTYNNEVVLGLREGSWLAMEKEKIHLRGKLSARLFYKNTIEELASGVELNQLLNELKI
ncbi:dipeptidase PepE [Psychroflexus salis]|uniref:Dipeptidase E n=1 Tax=Psychroflexus salis TaxID=1526574 RepID=A0A916ZR63_9FLAO|nr:dipeptidase PepE [Psychroflexus salis]GGE10118.1 dipeptidase E [Psychroflexus salis]